MTSTGHGKVVGTDGLIVQEPAMDTLLFVSACTPPYPVCYDLSHPNAPQIASDRDRAVLRALLNLALARLDDQEKRS